MSKYHFLGVVGCIFLCLTVSWAQDQSIDVVKLKHGGVIKGKLTESDTTKTMKMETLGGGEFTFEWSDVASLSRVALSTGRDSLALGILQGELDAAQSDSITVVPDKYSKSLEDHWYIHVSSQSEYGSVTMDSLKDEYLFTTKDSEHKVFSIKHIQSLQYGSSSRVLAGVLLGAASGVVGGFLLGGFIGMATLEDEHTVKSEDPQVKEFIEGFSTIGKFAKGASVGVVVGAIVGPIYGGMSSAPETYTFEGKNIEERKQVVMKIFTSSRKK
jgi:hypothetical protein